MKKASKTSASSISTGALFLMIGMIYDRYHTRMFKDYGGLGRIMPVFSFFLAMAPSFTVYTLLLVPTGLTALTVMVSANAMVQLSVDQAVRGRVMALYMAVFFGGTPIGSPIIGWVGETFGARWTILIATIACGITAVAAIIYVMRHDNLRLRVRASWARPLYLERDPVLTEPIPEKVT